MDLSHLGLTPTNEKRLSALLGTERDYERFMGDFWQGVQRQGFAISSFHEVKLEECKMTLSEFSSLFERNRREALHQLFLTPVSKYELDMLDEALSKGFSLEQLYLQHKSEPTKKLLRILL